MTVFIEVLILLVSARLCGELAERAGQAAAVGELLAGMLLAAAIAAVGPGIPLLTGLGDSPTVLLLAQLGVFALILQAGVEMEPGEIREASLDAFLIALGGLLLPLGCGFLFGLAILPEGEQQSAQALVVGIAMSITAIPATVRVLEELGLLHSRIGRTVVAASLFDDIMGMILLAILTAIIEAGEVPGATALLWLLLKVAAFFLVTGLLGAKVYPHVSRSMGEMRAAALELSALVCAALLYGVIAEALGVHWILGAFMAGLYFEKERIGKVVFRDTKLFLEMLTRGLLAPIFFLSIGLQLRIDVFYAIPVVLVTLTVIAFAAKMAGAGLPALARGFGRRGAATVGTAMTARGAVELVILGLVAQSGLFPKNGTGGVAGYMLSALVVMAALNTLAAPLALRRLNRILPAKPEQ